MPGSAPAARAAGRPLRRSERMSAILQTLTETGTVHVGDLSERFYVSEATLRRDLALLEQQRLLTRTHGGAVAADLAYELPVRYRSGQQRDAKRAIAAEAVRRVPPGATVVGLTGGTTTTEVARQLADRTDLTVVTNALNIAMDLVLRPQLKLIVVGGVSRPQSYELVGPWADEVIATINLGIVFVGVDGITPDGITTHDETEARTDRMLISRAQRVVIVADGSKVGRIMLARIAPLQSVHELVTDSSADPQALAAIRQAGVAVTVTDPG